jgi:hypothetical protein
MNGYCPAELLMGRKLRTTLPIIPSSLIPKIVDARELRWKEERRILRQKGVFFCRYGVKEKDKMFPGEVWFKDMRTWGKILKQADTPWSYVVETPNGTIRLNSFHLTSAPRQEEESCPEDEKSEERDEHEQQLEPEPVEEQSSPEKQRQQRTPPDPRYRTG